MFRTIEWAADCEMRFVICFLNAKNVLPREIHHQICQVYGDDAMSDGMVRKRVWMFNEGRENVHDEARSNNNNNIYLLQLGCYPVAVVILHVNKHEIGYY